MASKLEEKAVAKTALKIGIREASEKLEIDFRKVKYIVAKTGFDKRIREKKLLLKTKALDHAYSEGCISAAKRFGISQATMYRWYKADRRYQLVQSEKAKIINKSIALAEKKGIKAVAEKYNINRKTLERWKLIAKKL